jgi:outer membrane lipoprotein SlyB
MSLRLTLFQFFLGVVVIASLYSGKACALAYSQKEWDAITSSQVEEIVAKYYVFLGKNTVDLATFFEREMDKSVKRALLAQRDLEQIKFFVAQGLPGPSQFFREARLRTSFAKAIADDAFYLNSLYQRARATDPCRTQAIESFSKPFSGSTVANTAHYISVLQNQILEAKANAIESLYFEVTLSLPEVGNPLSVRKVDMPDKNKNDTEKKVIAISTAAGALIGSLVPGLGTAAGAMLGNLAGAVIGNVLCSVLELGNSAKLIAEIREQIGFVISASQKISTAGVSSMAELTCHSIFNDPQFKDYLTKIDEGWNQKLVRLAQLSKLADQTHSEIKENFQNEIDKLQIETYRVVKDVAHEKFELFFSDLRSRSKVSREFANAHLVAPISVLGDESKSEAERYEAEQNISKYLIEGDAKFSGGEYFSFQPETATAGNAVGAWDGTYRAITLRLNRIVATEVKR